MNIKTKLLLLDLTNRTEDHITTAKKLIEEPLETLNWREKAESWSILECIEHLNLYGDFYLPEIEKQIAGSKFPQPTEYFKSGLLGNYFAKSMLPKEKLNKMKTFRDKNPLGSSLSKLSIEKFISQQKEVLLLLNKASSINLTKTKTAISISKLIKLRLGDTFRVLVYHNQRHLVQAERTLRKQQTKG